MPMSLENTNSGRKQVRLLAAAPVLVVLGLALAACSGNTRQQDQTTYCDDIAQLRTDVRDIRLAAVSADRERLENAVSRTKDDMRRLKDATDDEDEQNTQRLTQAVNDISDTFTYGGYEHLASRGLDDAVDLDLGAMDEALNTLDRDTLCSNSPVEPNGGQISQ
jgi:hypothetical protein